MSQDIIADTLNQIMNAKKAKKPEITVKKHSKFLISLLDLMKRLGYVSYKIKGKELFIEIKKINDCRAIKPRFNVSFDDIDRHIKGLLPSRDFGFVIISTSKGLMTHTEAIEKNIGGSLIAYVY